MINNESIDTIKRQSSHIPIVVSGPSGVGKGTLIKKALPSIEDLEVSVSMTTRSPRPGEQEGVNYFFVNEERFIQAVQNHELLEWAKVHDNYYGTPLAPLNDKLLNGNDVLLEIDVQGAASTRSLYSECLLIFIVPPNLDELKRRLEGRAKSADDNLEKRFQNAVKELQFMNIFDYIIINDDPDQAAHELTNIIINNRLKTDRILTKMEQLGLMHGDGS